MTVAQAKAAFERAPDFEPEPPRPLRRPAAAADPFPLDVLGGVLRPAAEAIVDKVQCPAAIAGQSVLAAATLAVQGHADVELPHGRGAPLSSYFVTVAESGERKNGSDAHATRPIREREEALRAEDDAAVPAYLNRRDAWEAERRRVLGGRKLSAEQRRAELEALGPAPEAPLIPLLTCGEPTFEGLCRLLPGGHPGIGVFSVEGGQFVGGHGMNPDNRLKTAAALSALWDGEPIKRVRAGDGTVILPGRRLAMHLMVQPGVAARLLRDPSLADQGLLGRVLVTAPASTAGTRFWREPRPESAAALRRYGARLLEILGAPPPLAPGKRNELRPRTLPLAPAARTRLAGFSDHVERSLAPGAAFEPIRPLANKLTEHAARLAAVLALVDDLGRGELPTWAAEAGIVLAEHYATEAMRLAETEAVDPELALAERVRGWLHGGWEHGPVVSLVDIYTYCPVTAIRSAQVARRITGILAEHGWLVPAPDGTVVRGKPRRECWRIVGGG